MKSGCRSCALAAASSSALGINHRKTTHTSTSRSAMPVRSSAPIALRYSASIRAWAHTKLIRQIAVTVTGTELKSCNTAASFVMPAAANQRQAPSSRGLGTVHDGHERFEFWRRIPTRKALSASRFACTLKERDRIGPTARLIRCRSERAWPLPKRLSRRSMEDGRWQINALMQPLLVGGRINHHMLGSPPSEDHSHGCCWR